MEKLLEVIEIQGEKLNVYFDQDILLETLRRSFYVDLFTPNFILQGWEYKRTESGIFIELRPGMVDFISTRETLADTKRNENIIKEIRKQQLRLFIKAFFELIKEGKFSKEQSYRINVFWDTIYDEYFNKRKLSDEKYKRNTELIKDIYKPAEKIENIYRTNLKNHNSRCEQITGIPALINKNIILVYNYENMKEARDIAKKEIGILVLVKEEKDIHCLDELFDNIKYINASDHKRKEDKFTITGQKINFVVNRNSHIYTHSTLSGKEEIPQDAFVIISDLEYSNKFSTLSENKGNIYFIKTTKLATTYNKIKETNKVKVISKSQIKTIGEDLVNPDSLPSFKAFADMNPDLENEKIFNACCLFLEKITVYRFVRQDINLTNKIAKMFFKDYKEEKEMKNLNPIYDLSVYMRNGNYFYKKENEENLERMIRFMKPLSFFFISYLKDKKEGRNEVLDELFEVFKGDVSIDRMEIKNENQNK